MNAQFVLIKTMAWTTTFATPKVAENALRNTYIIYMKKETNINTNFVIFRIHYNSINYLQCQHKFIENNPKLHGV